MTLWESEMWDCWALHQHFEFIIYILVRTEHSAEKSDNTNNKVDISQSEMKRQMFISI